MFDNDTAEELAALLGQICVPMFVADRSDSCEGFKLVYINPAHEKASGLRAADVTGKLISDVLPPAEADVVNRKFSLCAETRAELRYTETLTMAKGRQDWDTTLQHVQMPDGRDRIVGASFQITCHDAQQGTIPLFDDIRYFAAVADFQLQNLVSMFEAAREDGLFNADSTQRVAHLSGVCRTVQRAVADIRNIVDRANTGRIQPEIGMLIRPGTASRDVLEDAGGSMLRALLDSAVVRRNTGS